MVARVREHPSWTKPWIPTLWGLYAKGSGWRGRNGGGSERRELGVSSRGLEAGVKSGSALVRGSWRTGAAHVDLPLSDA